MAQTLDTLPVGQRMMLTLIKDHAWHTHQMGMLESEQYRERFTWLHEHMERPFTDSTDPDLHWQYRWYAIPTHSGMGLVDGVLMAFKEDTDRTMFMLRWA